MSDRAHLHFARPRDRLYGRYRDVFLTLHAWGVRELVSSSELLLASWYMVNGDIDANLRTMFWSWRVLRRGIQNTQKPGV
jgi:hypothetical protein